MDLLITIGITLGIMIGIILITIGFFWLLFKIDELDGEYPWFIPSIMLIIVTIVVFICTYDILVEKNVIENFLPFLDNLITYEK